MEKEWFYPSEGQYPKENETVMVDTGLGEYKVVFKGKSRWESKNVVFTNPKRWRRWYVVDAE